MTLLSYEALNNIVSCSIVDAIKTNINSASIDLTLDDTIMIEIKPSIFVRMYRKLLGYKGIDLAKKENIKFKEVRIPHDGYLIKPGQFILASTKEHFDMPNDLAGEYMLKSSQARNCLQHLKAGWIDAGFSGKLTLEFKNVSQYEGLRIRSGMKAGQCVFFEHNPVPDHASYANTGQYNGQTKVQQSKGIQ